MQNEGRQIRWFTGSQYNMVRALERMSDKIEERGGFVSRPNEELEIRTRGYDEQINDLENRVHFWEKTKEERGDDYLNGSVPKAIEYSKKRLADVKEKDENAPRVVTKLVSCICDVGITFDLDGFTYVFYADSNPFFPDMFVKHPVGAISKFYFDKVESGDKDWLLNGMFEPVASYEVIDLCAEKLLEFLEKQKSSKPCDFMVTTA